MSPLRFLTSTEQFRAGLGAGLLGAFAVAAAALACGRRRLPVGGLAFAGAAGFALVRAEAGATAPAVPDALFAGVALAAGLAHLAWRLRPTPWALAAAAAPGAIVVAGALPPVAGWVRVTVVAFAAGGGALAATYDSSRRTSLDASLLLWLGTVAGVYWTVPDTETARVVLGAAIPLAALGWPLRWARLGAAGAVASTCMLGWVIGQGGAPRPGAVVGGAASIGLLALGPVVHRLWPVASPHAATALAVAYTAAAHLACVAAASRWAGLARDADTALLRLIVFAPIAVILTLGTRVVATAAAPP